MRNPLVSLASWYLKKKLSSYEGGSVSRRMLTWGINAYGPNTAISTDIDNLRHRARTLIRNNPHAANGVASWTANIVGRGITPRWNTDTKTLNDQILTLWEQCVPYMDADKLLDFYGLQALAARTIYGSGEVFGQFVINRKLEAPVPLQLKLIEGDQLNTDIDGPLPNGGCIVMGIELDAKGNRVAAHFKKSHPDEDYLVNTDMLESIRLKVGEYLHVYKPLRPGQVRGVTWLAPIITRLRQIDEYDDAELMRKKVAAMFAGFIKSPPTLPSAHGLPGTPTEDTTDPDIVYSHLEPGIMQSLGPGEDISWSEPADVGGNYVAWIKKQLHDVAAGMNITYEQLTGDLTDVDFSSIRAGLVEFRRRLEMERNNMIVHQLCRPFAARWLDMALLTPELTISDYYKRRYYYINTLWDPDAFAYVNPKEDVETLLLEVRGGLKPRRQALAERGGHDAERIDKQYQEDNQRADKLGLVFDSDPRKVARTGVSQEKAAMQEKSEERGGDPNAPSKASPERE